MTRSQAHDRERAGTALVRPVDHRCAILVVDDDSDVRDVLGIALRDAGYRVATVRTGREALDFLRSHAETCLIVLDLMMPAMDGVQFRAAQLRDRSLAWIPVIVTSAAVDVQSRAELRAARLLRKPFDLDELREAVESSTRACPNAKRAAELARPEARHLLSG